MAGLWERINQDAVDRLSVHALEAAIVLHQTDSFTKAQIRDALNTLLQTPLSAAEEADLHGMIDQLDAQGTVVNRLVYLQKVCAWTIAAEQDLVTENMWRGGLGI